MHKTTTRPMTSNHFIAKRCRLFFFTFDLRNSSQLCNRSHTSDLGRQVCSLFLFLFRRMGQMRTTDRRSCRLVSLSIIFIVIFLLYEHLSSVSASMDPEVVQRLNKRFRAADLVPDIIPRSPSEGPLRVRFWHDQAPEFVKAGNTLDTDQTQKAPHLSYPALPSTLFTVIMLDADSGKSNPIRWLIVNVPGDQIQYGSTIVGYRRPMVSPNSVSHRIALLVYRQVAPLNVSRFTALVSNINRARSTPFKLIRFASQHHLGQPKYGNYFYSQRA